MGFWGSLTGDDAAKAARQAAADTYAKQTAAANSYNAYGDTLPAAYANLAGGYQPWTQAGTDSLARLMAGLGLGGGPDGQKAFTDAYQNLPGYQSGLDTGLTSAQRALNAGHIGQSGAALKGLYRYGSDYENNRAGDYLNRLAGLSTQGLGATGSMINTMGQGLQGQQNVRQGVYTGMTNAAPTIGQGLVAGAQAQQQGVGNVMNLAANLAGKVLGGPLGGSLGSSLGSIGGLGGGGGVTAGSYGGIPYPIFG